MSAERVTRHEQGGPPGFWTVFSLLEQGMLKEDFASGIKVHSDLVYYDEIWDHFAQAPLPLRNGLLLGAATAGALLTPLVLGAPWPPFVPVWLVLAAAWFLFWAGLRRRTVRLYDFQGLELAELRGVKGAAMDRFLKELWAAVTRARFPLQATLETIDLGDCSVRAGGVAWRSLFLYDRVIFERRGPGGFGHREFFALTALRAPVGIRWRIPWIPVATGAACFLCAAPASWLARAAAGAGGVWLLGFSTAGLLSALLAAALLRVSVTVETGAEPVETPGIPWWDQRRRRTALAWLARLVKLADRVEPLDAEDYWEYHRAKLGLLKEEGFLEEWPYRSALARLNTQEREETGE
jgi:hypothetical protein